MISPYVVENWQKNTYTVIRYFRVDKFRYFLTPTYRKPEFRIPALQSPRLNPICFIANTFGYIKVRKQDQKSFQICLLGDVPGNEKRREKQQEALFFGAHLSSARRSRTSLSLVLSLSF